MNTLNLVNSLTGLKNFIILNTNGFMYLSITPIINSLNRKNPQHAAFNGCKKVEELEEKLAIALTNFEKGIINKCSKFETALKSYIGNPYILTLNSATAGLTLATRLLKNKDEKK